MTGSSGLLTNSMNAPDNDRRTHADQPVDLLLVAAFIGLSLIYNISAWARADIPSVPFLVIGGFIASAAAALGYLGSRRIEQALFVLPVTAALMTAPELPHLPFLREFGSFAAIGLALRIATHGSAWLAAVPQRLINAMGPALAILVTAYILISFVPMTSLIWNGLLFEAKVVGAEMIYECIALFIVATILLAISQLKEVALERLFHGIFVGAAGIIMLSVAAMALPFIWRETFAPADYLGFYYYCRMRMTAFGPDEYGAYLVFTAPVLLLMKSLDTGLWKTKVAGVCLYILPLLLIAGSSRAARIGLIATYVLAFAIPVFRRSVAGPAIFSTVVMLATLKYRCVSDYLSLYQGVPINGGSIPISSFFSDPARGHLLSMVVQKTTYESSLPLIFGHGAGLSAYDQFAVGGSSTLVDLFVDKGAIGFLIVAAVAAIAIWRITVGWKTLNKALRLYASIILLMIIPLMTSGATYDARRWLFAWITAAMILGAATLAKDAREAVQPPPMGERQAR